MAYAALLSLAHILEQTLNHDFKYLIAREKQQIPFLLKKISSLQDFLENFTQNNSTSTEYLESRIRDVAYEAEDLIECHITDRILSESASNGDNRFTVIGRELEKLIEDIDSIKKQVTKIQVESGVQDLQQGISLPVGSSKPASSGKSTLVGLDDDLMEIKTRLVGESSELETISVVGMGGIGKTTLARKVYDDEYIVYHFHIRAWVTVSQGYNVREILLDLLDSMKKLTNQMCEENSEQLAEILYKNLKGMRYLIIMDDVWDANVWDDVKRSFPNDKNGSRIMLTTRLENVAKYAKSCPPLHHMNFLNEDESWNLFCDKVFGKYCCPPELEKIGKKITKNCRGLPLAVVVIGGLLSKATRTQEYWRNVEENLTSIITSNDKQCLKILSLSYANLPCHLKGCFLYMGIFPEDYNIRVSELIKLWIAEGFVKDEKSRSLEDVAEEYFLDLVDRSLILVYDKRSNGKIKTCRIHDLLRDLCVREARKEKVFHVTDESFHGISRDIGVRRVSIHRNGKIPDGSIDIPPLLVRSFLGFGWHSCCPVDNFNLRLLRVWHMGLHKLPNEIIELANLRYLIARCNEGLSLASIYKLRCLQTIILNGGSRTRPLHLPPEIWQMKQLRHVQSKRMILPKARTGGGNSITVLENLQTLCIVKDFECTKDVRRRIPNLKKLGLDYDCEGKNPSLYCLNNLVNLRKLEALKCVFSAPCPSFMKNIKFPISLKNMTLKGCDLAWENMTIVVLLPNLEVLKLKSNAFKGGEWKPNEGEFLQLKFLLIKRNNLKHWRANSIHFPRLQWLVLKKCKYLEEIPSGFGEIPTFQLIELHECGDSVVTSAQQIKQEQVNFGNDAFQVHIHGKYGKF
ncbi:putative disease resistance RPP13-like protein 3 [Forsythia ovata]|uniref:Disease resistance RPP13-like protein 3 n=1 Tax=Forsythia ovata TaxID=205694 RepID=A0ABD1TRD4_9LAMI